MHLFERFLSVPAEELKLLLKYQSSLPWSDFYLNPRRLRGSDFLMRWSQGVWSEKRLIQAVGQTKKYFAVPYGPSGTAPDNNVRELEMYFERLEKAGLGSLKRPDLLIFCTKAQHDVERILKSVGGIQELPFISEDDSKMRKLLSNAILAVESENSLWKARQMPDFGSQLRPMRRLGGQEGLRSNAVVPTVILKEEDRVPLLKWQRKRRIKIHIWHVFYDLAFGLSLDHAQELIESGRILGTDQVFQAPGGATTRKVIYKFYYHYAYALGESTKEPRLVADSIVDRNGHILPYVKFVGGALALRTEARKVLAEAAQDAC